MRTLKSTLERSWETIYTLKLKDAPPSMYYQFYYEHTVAAGINLIDAYNYALTKEIPEVMREKLAEMVVKLRTFYGE